MLIATHALSNINMLDYSPEKNLLFSTYEMSLKRSKVLGQGSLRTIHDFFHVRI